MGRKSKPAYSYIRVNKILIATGKKCSRCGEAKLYEDFHKLHRSSDGRQPICKECKSIQNAKRCRSS